MESIKRVFVHLSKENSLPQCARFVQSITGHFCSPAEDKVFVHCNLENNKFLISDTEFDGAEKLLLKRPSFCPIKHLDKTQADALPMEILTRGVDVGVAVLVQSVNKKLLLTRRTATLRIFPNVWVPPGGHIELNEKLITAGLRELEEETGLRLEEGQFSCKMLGLWESTYPHVLSRGLPQRHHIVTYLLVLSKETHHQLQRLCPDECEVSACTWLEPRIVEAIVGAEDGVSGAEALPSDLPTSVRVTTLRNGSAVTEELPISIFLSKAPAEGPDVERVSTGTKYALQLWLDTLAQQPE
ncbi:nucleoside diphosphate-linked moiety X motif 17 isoform X2 [Latimeria chalumnae]|uniref:nucleoside diphosphate-linked moiety X motif 17 isoform X2 n=1 Tax=Latimeria chalumnae TaxID=7897 RepID=UPI00313DED3B